MTTTIQRPAIHRAEVAATARTAEPGRDVGLLALRVTIGLLMACHGAQKLFGWFGGPGLHGTGAGFAHLGYTPGTFFAGVAGTTEFGAGLLLALGALTPLACAGIIGVMTNVVFAVSWHEGLFGHPPAHQGFELPLLLGVGAVGLAFTGPGRLSVDGVLGLDRRWARLGGGVLVGLGGVLLGVIGALVVMLGFKS